VVLDPSVWMILHLQLFPVSPTRVWRESYLVFYLTEILNVNFFMEINIGNVFSLRYFFKIMFLVVCKQQLKENYNGYLTLIHQSGGE